ncbi:Nicotinate-nucleotide adenylyltransferase [hydrothermal vent metagenome]|uniref:Nicotinate-nucleotide adenylyltransferase n=1 Tax=hydrothermal vent metagenome TaxID=652676 RepID=A0A1W1BPH7_9ZZZZ
MIGFLGGSFNPVHLGHLKIAKQVKKQLNLEKLFLMPCGIPPHKKDLFFNQTQRLELLKIALEDYPELSLDTREIDNNKINYTIDTLKQIKKEYPKEKVFFIMGSDSFNNLHTWKDYKNIKNYAQLVVISRPYNQNKIQSDILFINDIKIDISSSKIIKMINNNQDISSLVGQKIAKKITSYL